MTMNIQQVKFSTKNYYQVETKKIQITIHHTVSGDGIAGDVAWWDKTPEREGAPFIIGRQGEIYQLFDEKYWAYHLGLKSEHFKPFGLSYINLNENSIPIEIDSWGPVLPYGGKYYPVRWDKDSRKHVPDQKKASIISYPEEYCGNGYKKYPYFERYYTKQLESLQRLLKFLCEKHDIPTQYKGDRFWNPNKDALSGEPGIFGHVAYRPDKSDPHPQPELVNVLKSISC
jgi:N-acetyl-anhydromuramyl-L-alanine amidase AmpD